MTAQGQQERQVGDAAQDDELGERLGQAVHRLAPVRSPDDELGDHGVEAVVDAAPLDHAGVHAHALAARLAVAAEIARRWQEAVARVLGQDAGLQGHALGLGHPEGAGIPQRLGPAALGQLQLGLDQIHAIDCLGDGMLHLETGVHLQEVELPLGVHQELDGARPPVAGLPHQGHGGPAEGLAQGQINHGAGRLLDDLLVAPLQAALALAEKYSAALAIAEDLHLDVARRGQVALHEDGAVPEARQGLAGGLLDGLGQAGQVWHHTHAPAAASAAGLDQEGRLQPAGLQLRPPDRRGHRRQLMGEQGRQGGHAAVLGQPLGGFLGAQGAHGLGPGAQEGDARGLHGLGELGVLGEEPVARVHQGRAPGHGRGDDLRPGEEARDLQHRVRFLADAGVRVLRRADHGHGQAALAARAQHAASDLTPVGDEQASRHRRAPPD